VKASSDAVYRMGPDWTEMRQLDGRAFMVDTPQPSAAWLDRYIQPEDQAQLVQAIQDATRNRTVFELEHRVIRVDGTVGWTASRAVPLLDTDGTVVEWVGTASDITDRKRADLLDHEHRRVLELIATGAPPDQVLTAVTASIGLLAPRTRACIVVADATGDTIDAAFTDHFPDAFGNGLRGVPLVAVAGPHAQEHAGADVWRALCAAHGVQAVHAQPIFADDGSGVQRRVATLLLCLDETREPSSWERRVTGFGAHVAGVAIERSRFIEGMRATERALREQQAHRAEAEQALREANRRKDEFLAMLSHELRNPLGPVRNAVHYLKSRDLPDPDLARPVEMIDRQVTHMARLIDDLLDVARIARGIHELRRERIDFRDIVRAAVDDCRDDVERNEHTLLVDVAAEPLPVDGDRHRLIQVLCNLVSNAIKYTPAGGRIELVACRSRDGLEVRVHDNGIGIPADKLAEVFELFAQVNRSLDRQGGLGIGLTLARDLVLLHGGTIEAKSDGDGAGTTMVVRLPLALAPAASAPVARSAPAPAGRGLRILIADDHEDAAESLALILEAAGHVVRRTHDGEAALAAVSEFAPDVALVDIGMPKVDGYQVAQRLRAMPATAAVRLVALTGWGQERDRERARAAGFDAHLVKPVAPETLTRLLAEIAARGDDPTAAAAGSEPQTV